MNKGFKYSVIFHLAVILTSFVYISVSQDIAPTERIIDVVKRELSDLKQRYGDKRKTVVVKGMVGELSDEDLIIDESCIVTISESGYIKRLKEGIRTRILTWEYGAHINWGLIHPSDEVGVFHLDDRNKAEEVVNKRKNQNYYLSQYTSNQMERFYNRLLALDSRAVKDIVEDFVNRTYKKK